VAFHLAAHDDLTAQVCGLRERRMSRQSWNAVLGLLLGKQVVRAAHHRHLKKFVALAPAASVCAVPALVIHDQKYRAKSKTMLTKQAKNALMESGSAPLVNDIHLGKGTVPKWAWRHAWSHVLCSSSVA